MAAIDVKSQLEKKRLKGSLHLADLMFDATTRELGQTRIRLTKTENTIIALRLLLPALLPQHEDRPASHAIRTRRATARRTSMGPASEARNIGTSAGVRRGDKFDGAAGRGNAARGLASVVENSCGFPKIHKQSVPLRPIVSSIGSVTYELAGFLAKILGTLVGKTQHHVKNSADFVNKIKDIHVEDDETITSYDVCSPFTSIPPKEAVSVVREALEADDTLADRTNLSVDQVCELLELCLGCTYFTYKGQFYQQMHGCAMGSPVSPIVVNLYMEKPRRVGFLYRKPTHTDQYLAFDSHHPLEHKLAVIKTLFHRADNIVTSDQAKTDEHRHLRGALAKCSYQNWTFNKALKPSDQSKKTQKCKPLTNKNKANITIPYVQGVSEKLRRIFQNFNIATNFKPHSTLRQRLVHPKDRPHKGTKANVIYRLKCEEPNCNNTYIGETSRPLKVRYKEHCRPSANGYSSAIIHHLQHNQGHSFKFESTDILDRETRWWERGVKEAIYERMYNPTLNREGGLRVDLSGT
ncbi:hypothetical protein Bbelb_291040 [Branchiostoma belcheri]|nr:hypothetical protein Bbelb_291040 [Branchiostoma belcheri]